MALFLAVSLVFTALALWEAARDAPTFDEPVYVSAGLATLLHHDVTLNEEHPPLSKVLADLPVLLAHPVIPPDHAWDTNNERSYSAAFVAAQVRAGRLRSVTFASRVVPVLETLATAVVILALAGLLFGPWPAAVAGVAWLASPLVLGLGHLDGVDVPFALATVLTAWAAVSWLRRAGRWRLVAVGAAAGLAVSCSATGALVAAGAALAVALGRGPAGAAPPGSPPGEPTPPGSAPGEPLGRPGLMRVATRVAIVAGVAWALVWAVYLVLDPAVFAHPGLLPRPYLDGLHYLDTNDSVPGPGYLLGRAWTGGRWWYWPVSLVLKEPLLITLLVAAAPLGLLIWARRRQWAVTAAVGLPAVGLTVFDLALPRDIGVRYLLPVLALALVAAAGVLSRIPPPGRWLAGAGLVMALAATVASAPGSLSWVALPFRPAYANLTDSNLDWGQGLYALESWDRGKDARVDYFGARGLAPAALPGTRPLVGVVTSSLRGWVAVSATALNSADRGHLAWLRSYCPVDLLDGTILVYRFRTSPGAVDGDEAQRSRPPDVCPGSWSRRTG